MRNKSEIGCGWEGNDREGTIEGHKGKRKEGEKDEGDEG